MNNSSRLFSRIPNSLLFILLLVIFLLKIVLYVLISSEILIIKFSGGGDSEYYDSYAKGFINVAVNIWPVMLRYLNDYNLYSRSFISYGLFILNIVVIPVITCNLAGLDFKKNQKHYLYCFLLCLIYPTIYLYTFDVYRDVFMVFSFLIGCLAVRTFLYSSNFLFFIFNFIVCIVIGFFLLGLRPYLGYAFFLSLFLWKIKFNKKRVVFLGLLYFIALFIANYIGLLDSLTEYRLIFEELGGGSTLGLDFSNPLMFIPNFIFSLLGQMFGLYITNPLALVILIIETIPFVFMLAYVFKNIKLADSFLRFLIIFFVLYGSIWLIGNDNLGTAVRLRIYNYLAIYICFFQILNLKKLKVTGD